MGATPALDLFEVIEVDLRRPPGVSPNSPGAEFIPTFRLGQKRLDHGLRRVGQDQCGLKAVVGQPARVCRISRHFSPHRDGAGIIAAKAALKR
jgi:hypothetical protein